MKKIEGTQGAVTRPDRPLVLYVEDNDDNWGVAELRLGKTYRMLRAANDRAACDLFGRHQHELYVVLMDVELQGSKLDGIELTRLFRGQRIEQSLPHYAQGIPRSDVPIVYVTAYYNELTPELRAAGGNMVIAKPVRFMELMRALTDLHLGRMRNPS